MSERKYKYKRVGNNNHNMKNGMFRMRSSCCRFSGGLRLRLLRLNLRRFSVSKLRARFMSIFRRIFLGRREMMKSNNSSRSSSSSWTSLITKEEALQKDLYRRPHQLQSYNSFYAEAIADCLEFIKRSSISVDQ